MTIIFAETPVPDRARPETEVLRGPFTGRARRRDRRLDDLLWELTVTPRQPTIGLHFRHPRDFGKRAVAAPSGVRLNSSLIVAAANGVAHPIWTDSRRLGALGEEIYTTRLRESDVLKR